MSEYQPTPHLRFERRRVRLKPYTKERLVLQQLWVMHTEIHETYSEWRDVPTVEQEVQK